MAERRLFRIEGRSLTDFRTTRYENHRPHPRGPRVRRTKIGARWPHFPRSPRDRLARPRALGCRKCRPCARTKHPMPCAGGQGVPLPAKRCAPVVRRGADAFGVLVPEVAAPAVAASGASGYRGGAAVVTGRADARATKPRIEGGMSPGDWRRAHGRGCSSRLEMSRNQQLVITCSRTPSRPPKPR